MQAQLLLTLMNNPRDWLLERVRSNVVVVVHTATMHVIIAPPWRFRVSFLALQWLTFVCCVQVVVLDNSAAGGVSTVGEIILCRPDIYGAGATVEQAGAIAAAVAAVSSGSATALRSTSRPNSMSLSAAACADPTAAEEPTSHHFTTVAV
jgi:hypothetical protein